MFLIYRCFPHGEPISLPQHFCMSNYLLNCFVHTGGYELSDGKFAIKRDGWRSESLPKFAFLTEKNFPNYRTILCTWYEQIWCFLFCLLLNLEIKTIEDGDGLRFIFFDNGRNRSYLTHLSRSMEWRLHKTLNFSYHTISTPDQNKQERFDCSNFIFNFRPHTFIISYGFSYLEANLAIFFILNSNGTWQTRNFTL